MRTFRFLICLTAGFLAISTPVFSSPPELPPPTIRVIEQPLANPPTYKTPVLGWMGFATTSFGSGRVAPKYPWSVFHPTAAALIYCNETTDCKAWQKVRIGTGFRGLGSDGKTQRLVFSGISHPKEGCVGGNLDRIEFRGETRFPEGIVWIVPEKKSGEVALPEPDPSGLEVKRVESTQTRLAWQVGPLKIQLESNPQDRTKTEADLSFWREDQKIYRALFHQQEGAKGSIGPINLLSPPSLQYGLPQPMTAFDFGNQKTVVVAWMPAASGSTFLTFLVENSKLNAIEAAYLQAGSSSAGCNP